MYFLSDISDNAEFKKGRGRDKVKRKKRTAKQIREDIRNNRDRVNTITKPVNTAQKLWSTLNNTSREVRSWKKTLGI